jgi:hypothetical protein
VEKDRLLEEAKLHFSTKLRTLDAHIRTVQDAANQESKSSVGDKYETGRAMAQNEVFQLKTQYEALRQEVEKLTHEHISAGHLIKTRKGWFFLGAALGKFNCEGKAIFFISLDSPLGTALHRKKKGEDFLVNAVKDEVLDLL